MRTREELGGNAYRSSGCGPETTYVCNYPELPERSRQYFTCVREGTELPKTDER